MFRATYSPKIEDLKNKPVVLLYSGGLDTSTMLVWLQENYKCEVISCTVSIGQKGKDFKQLEETGIASFSVYHGDHVLVIWFDKDGNIRGHDVFKAVEFRVVGPPEGWKRVNLPRTPQKKLNLLIADRGKKIYSDVFFTGDVSMMLGLVEAVSDRRIISVDEAKYFLIPMGDYVYVIEKNFSEKYFKFFHRGIKLFLRSKISNLFITFSRGRSRKHSCLRGHSK